MATRPSPITRTSTSKALSPPLESYSTTLVSASASLNGSYPIRLGPHAIIQPRSQLLSAVGPIDIGEGCIISERASIGSSKSASPQLEIDARTAPRVTLAQGVLIECGATVEAASIGAFTVVEAGAKIGRGAVLGRDCKICARVQIGEGEIVGDGIVVYGNGWGEKRMERRGGVMDGKREAWAREQGEVLRKAWTGK